MSEIHTIFPTTIYKDKLNRNFSNQEINYLYNEENNLYPNQGNHTSKNTYVLEHPSLLHIKKFILEKVNYYIFNIINPINKITPYITQSWLNITSEGEYHHNHEHSNSILSGVFYVSADKNFDSIRFFKAEYDTIQLPKKEYNLFNSTSWLFPVETGELILFPSRLEHCVERKNGTNKRISIAFNTFIKGKIGDEISLNELIL